ncbi:hypothetical protein COCSADRAFT_309754 [Bipolaris sorokiniana ND90Pr]|uniref:Uncharacterized protein n=1 Tax=Cochliobolus sativus (strain ND90Pr / ATCC 201652) TaxID=665912 RepID=M2SES0_COCSN|nr:uncharacterized protein COCSADRAFT_309754 [Bipolaris sorokiniana ND90Pr]EMD65788.1 hypothetical protein COCSADRAFT_309754 [Bipolaris sorokiniana ND90Pr]
MQATFGNLKRLTKARGRACRVEYMARVGSDEGLRRQTPGSPRSQSPVWLSACGGHLAFLPYYCVDPPPTRDAPHLHQRFSPYAVRNRAFFPSSQRAARAPSPPVHTHHHHHPSPIHMLLPVPHLPTKHPIIAALRLRVTSKRRCICTNTRSSCGRSPAETQPIHPLALYDQAAITQFPPCLEI